MAALSRLLRTSARTPEQVFQQARRELGRRPRILDFGVGFGRLAIPRLLSGYDLYGLDNSPIDVERGQRALGAAGLDPQRIRLIERGRPSFPDGHFDVIYSEDVLEHVRDLEPVVEEIKRLTAPGGIGLHSYPGHRRVVESHLGMPFVQWLPRNGSLWLPIAAAVFLGREPESFMLLIDGQPIDVAGKTRIERADAYYRWMISHTFYRPRRDVDRAFRALDFTVSSPRNGIVSALTHEYVETRLNS